MTHPKGNSITLGQEVQLTCSYFSQTEVIFNWMKDGGTLDVSKWSNVVWDGSKIKQRNLTIQRLTLTVSDPDMQGFYSCLVKDKLGNSVRSERVLVRIQGK